MLLRIVESAIFVLENLSTRLFRTAHPPLAKENQIIVPINQSQISGVANPARSLLAAYSDKNRGPPPGFEEILGGTGRPGCGFASSDGQLFTFY